MSQPRVYLPGLRQIPTQNIGLSLSYLQTSPSNQNNKTRIDKKLASWSKYCSIKRNKLISRIEWNTSKEKFCKLARKIHLTKRKPLQARLILAKSTGILSIKGHLALSIYNLQAQLFLVGDKHCKSKPKELQNQRPTKLAEFQKKHRNAISL